MLGANDAGQLGDGTTTERHTSVDVSGLTSGVAAVSAGFFDTCALTTAGGLKCWGNNAYGQLGDGTNTERDTPVDVSGLTNGVVAVSTGLNFTCAVTTGGGVKCWGDNIAGQLGDGTTTERHTPDDVSGLTSGMVAVTAGFDNACGVTSAGGVKCWGYNDYGQLGAETTETCFDKDPCSTVPVDVVGLGPKATVTPTLTPTSSPTQTPTPTPPALAGDANKDGSVNAIDAALVLQYSAGLLPSINSNADVNRDGLTNAVDAALVLQYIAGLIPSLPV